MALAMFATLAPCLGGPLPHWSGPRAGGGYCGLLLGSDPRRPGPGARRVGGLLGRGPAWPADCKVKEGRGGSRLLSNDESQATSGVGRATSPRRAQLKIVLSPSLHHYLTVYSQYIRQLWQQHTTTYGVPLSPRLWYCSSLLHQQTSCFTSARLFIGH